MASNIQSFKSHIEKSNSKQKPVKSDVLEEDEDENESKDQLDLIYTHFVFNTQNNSFNLLFVGAKPTMSFKVSSTTVPIFIWVQNFRI